MSTDDQHERELYRLESKLAAAIAHRFILRRTLERLLISDFSQISPGDRQKIEGALRATR